MYLTGRTWRGLIALQENDPFFLPLSIKLHRARAFHPCYWIMSDVDGASIKPHPEVALVPQARELSARTEVARTIVDCLFSAVMCQNVLFPTLLLVFFFMFLLLICALFVCIFILAYLLHGQY